MKQAGFQVLSIDHVVADAQVPIIPLDLTQASGQQILWSILEAPNLSAVHLGLPCGTASRARDRPVSQELQARGVPNPPPLRDESHLLGKPNLGKLNQARVQSANILYQLGFNIALFCLAKGKAVSIENPGRSWLWAIFILFSMELDEPSRQLWNTLVMVQFHACCHGSTRRKLTGWLSTPGVFQSLQAECQNDHPHEAWGVSWNGSHWSFDTSGEAAYPPLLAQRAASCLMRFAQQNHWALSPPSTLHDLSTAAHGRQSRKHRPLIPEYHHVVTCPADTPITENCKLLPPHLGGEYQEESATEENNSTTNGAEARKLARMGFYHTPKQFLSMAKEVLHPMDSTNHLGAPTAFALECNLRYEHRLIKLERKKNLLQAKLLVAKNKEDEKRLHDELPESLSKVLEGKQLLAWQQLLQKFEYDDMEVVNFMLKGAPLVGTHDTPSCYPAEIRPATLTEGDLKASSLWRRKAIINKVRSDIDPSHVEHLEETALEELELGFMEGPFRSEQEVTDYFGHNQWSVIRRFVLVQGAELKLRPIDDCLEAQLNQAYTSTSYLKLQDVDYITGLALKISEAVVAGRQKEGSGQWMGKCLDLSKAYKQLGVLPQHRYLAVVFYHDSEGSPKFYVANSLMFGATAAVYSFNRVSRSLWWLMNRMLLIPCGVYFDDYPMFSPAELIEDADQAAGALLDLLGWRFARTGTKGKPFMDEFQVLGCNLRLGGLRKGMVTVENKQGRIDRLLEHLREIADRGTISQHEAQVLHGLLRYSCGFFSGRLLHQVCAEVVALAYPSGRRVMDLASFCKYASETLKQCKPRDIRVGGETAPILIFTDGSYENGKAGIGAVILDMSSGMARVLAGEVPQALLDKWQADVGDQLICQVELYVMVAVRWLLGSSLMDRRSLWWVDNNAARFTLIKGVSPSLTLRDLAREFYAVDALYPSYSWIERVPSYSNPSDAPSRGQPQIACALVGISQHEIFEHPSDLLKKLLTPQLVDKRGR